MLLLSLADDAAVDATSGEGGRGPQVGGGGGVIFEEVGEDGTGGAQHWGVDEGVFKEQPG